MERRETLPSRLYVRVTGEKFGGAMDVLRGTLQGTRWGCGCCGVLERGDRGCRERLKLCLGQRRAGFSGDGPPASQGTTK